MYVKKYKISALTNTKHVKIMTLQPEEVANLKLEYYANVEGISNCIVKLYIANNPYDAFEVSIF